VSSNNRSGMISQGEEDCSFCLMSIVFFFLQAEGTYQCKMRQSLRQCRSLLFFVCLYKHRICGRHTLYHTWDFSSGGNLAMWLKSIPIIAAPSNHSLTVQTGNHSFIHNAISRTFYRTNQVGETKPDEIELYPEKEKRDNPNERPRTEDVMLFF